MQTVSTVFEAELRKRIAARMDELASDVVSGVLEYPAYKHVCGRISGMSEVLDMCIEVNDDIHKR